MIQHDPRCDERHTPRQRCNRRMTLAAARLARLAVDAAVAEPPEEHAPQASEFVPEPDPVRDAVATIDLPAPTAYASREWNETAASVEQVRRPPSVPAPRPIVQSDPGRNAALIGAAFGFVLLLFAVRRRRQPTDS